MNRHLVAVFLGVLPALTAPSISIAAEASKAPAGAAASKPAGGAAAPAAKPEAAAANAPAAKAEAPTAAETTFAYIKAPLFSDDFGAMPVARIEGEIITMDQLTGALAGVHGAAQADDRSKAGKKDFMPVLDRLINARLLVLEAREMGIDELPEFKESVKEGRAGVGQEILKSRVLEDVKADPAEVERVYKDSVREWKVRSILVFQDATAKAFQADLKAGKTFDALVKQVLAEKKGEGGEPADFLPRAKMLPQILNALQGLKAGQVSPSAKVREGWAILEVHDVRYPENPEARAQAEAVVLAEFRKQALQKYYAGLVKKHAKINKGLLAALDFEARKPGLTALKKDRRVLASFSGGETPITVGDLATALAEGFFHGADRAVAGKKINMTKLEVFDGLLARKVIPIEVKEQRIQDSREFVTRFADFESNLLFTRFLEKAIVPEIKLGEPEVKAYWEAHKADYSYPAFWKVESLAFGNAKAAQAAIEKLRSGTDFKWLNANAEGQLKPSERKTSLTGVLAASALPKDVAAALAGARKGDYRLYASPEGQHYAVHVVDYTPPTAQPFAEVRDAVEQRFYLDSLGKAIEEWAGKLRKHRKVEVFITRIGS